MNLAIETLPRADHLSFPFGDRAGPIAGPEHHAVWIVLEVILNRLEERLRLFVVRVPANRRVRLTWPVHLRVRRMPLPEHLPVLRIPGIVERFHPLQVLFSTHASPRFYNSRPSDRTTTRGGRSVPDEFRRLAEREL